MPWNVEAPSDKDVNISVQIKNFSNTRCDKKLSPWQVEDTAGKQGRKDVMEALRRFKAYQGETEGRPAAKSPSKHD